MVKGAVSTFETAFGLERGPCFVPQDEMPSLLEMLSLFLLKYVRRKGMLFALPVPLGSHGEKRISPWSKV